MPTFTALTGLPDALDDLGLQVWVADGWKEGQCEGDDHYLWTDPDTEDKSHDLPPYGYMVHHTAGTSATPPPHDTSTANAWIGLERDGKLYQDGGGVPTVYLASAGPCRISSGYGYRWAAWDRTFLDLRAPAHAEGSDGTTALNRYVFNVETVHAGDGGPIDAGVWESVVGLGIALQEMFGWTERTLGHTSWTNRKIDPKWAVGLPNDGKDCIVDIQNAIVTEDETAPNIGECDSWQVAAWQKAYDFGYINDDSHPQHTLNKGDYWVFQDRTG